jgi:prephenate dehydrogenase
LKFKRIAIVGTGLIGASFGLALQRSARRVRVVGWDRNRANASLAKRRGAIAEVASTFDAAIASADLVVLAAPLTEIEKLIPKALARARAGALVLDVAPLKTRVAAIATASLRRTQNRARFVAGHPLAGSESSGPAAADAKLFAARPFILYAPAQPRFNAARRDAEHVVRALGAIPVWLDPAEHDRVIATTSALPQLAAIALALAAQRMLGRRGNAKGGLSGARLAGPGFEGATRLADSPFLVWEGALAGNVENVRRALKALEQQLGDIAATLERGDTRAMSNRFRAAAAARRRILGTPRRS